MGKDYRSLLIGRIGNGSNNLANGSSCVQCRLQRGASTFTGQTYDTLERSQLMIHSVW